MVVSSIANMYNYLILQLDAYKQISSLIEAYREKGRGEKEEGDGNHLRYSLILMIYVIQNRSTNHNL